MDALVMRQYDSNEFPATPEALRTRHSLNSLSKRNISTWSSRFSSLYSVSSRSFTL